MQCIKYFFEIGSIKKPESSEKFREFQIRNYNGVGLIVLWVFCHYILNGQSTFVRAADHFVTQTFVTRSLGTANFFVPFFYHELFCSKPLEDYLKKTLIRHNKIFSLFKITMANIEILYLSKHKQSHIIQKACKETFLSNKKCDLGWLAMLKKKLMPIMSNF